MFSFTPPIVKQLLALKKEGPGNEQAEKWSEKAVKSLVKKLKKSGTSDELLKAIVHEDSETDCVTIPRSLDGRLQVSQKKCLPHFVYCRIWRYPDIVSHHDIRPVDNCKHSFHLRRPEVCVNPYHYEKVTAHNQNAGGAQSLDLNNTSELNSNIPSLNNLRITDQPELFHCDERTFNSETPDESAGLRMLSNTVRHFASPSEKTLSDTGAISPEDPEEFQLILSNAGHGLCSSYLYTEPKFWCSVHYFELGTKIGEPFHAAQPYITIDGYTDPTNTDRFCLGLLANASRNSVVEQTRKFIGKGVRLYCLGGEVYAECLSESAIFVQSPICNRGLGWNESTVCKIPPGCNFKIFSYQEFANQLSENVKNNFETAYFLINLCYIRISFVKGWGSQYRRQKVTSTPCWIEIHLNGPLQWLDKVLKQLGSPALKCSSVT